MLFFSWLRNQVRNAVLGGVRDALHEMNNAATLPAPIADGDDKTIGEVMGVEQRVDVLANHTKRKVVRQ